MAGGAVANLKQLAWQSVRAQILQDININPGNWAIHAGSLVRVPPLALGVPFRILFIPASQAMAHIPDWDGNLEVLSAVIPDLSLPVPLRPLVFHFGAGAPWYDINNVALPLQHFDF